jgi:acetate kinase
LDAIIFTAGIGENAVSIRERVCRDAQWLGVELDSAANKKPDKSGRITKANSRVAAWVLATNEELMIAQHTLRVLGLKHLKEESRMAA